MTKLSNIIIYLYNSKNIIEVQRLNKKWLDKNNFSLSDYELEIFLNKEKLCNFLIKNNLINIPETINFYDKCECKYCGSKTKFVNIQKGWKKYCSRSCAAIYSTNPNKVKQTKLEKYGSENYNNMEKQKQTLLEKYGENYTFKIDEVKRKSRKTMLEKYGVEYTLQCNKLKEKVKNTCLEKYGVDHPCKNLITKQKIKQTFLKRYGVEWNSQIKYVKLNIKNKANARFFKRLAKSDLNSLREMYLLYRKLVTHYTNRQNLNELNNISKRSVNFHLDHKVSVFEGFINGILPCIIGNISNLEIISRRENCVKNKKSSITIEELIHRYENNIIN